MKTPNLILNEAAVVFSALALRFIGMKDLRARRVMPALLVVAIAGAVMVPSTSVILGSCRRHRLAACDTGFSVLNNLADMLSIGALGYAAFLRARAMVDAKHHRLLHVLMVVYAAYAIILFCNLLEAAGVAIPQFGCYDYIVLGINLAVALNTLCLELCVIRGMHQGLNRRRFHPFRRTMACIQAHMIANFVVMASACILTLYNSKTAVTVMAVATSSHIFAFCWLNQIVQMAFNETVEFSLSALNEVSNG